MKHTASRGHGEEQGRPEDDAGNIALSDAVGPFPLVVAVDMVLIKSDLRLEVLLHFLAQTPLDVWKLLPGRSTPRIEPALRSAAADSNLIDTIPLRDETVTIIREAQAAERPVYLVSASERGLVDQLAARIGDIAGVFATDQRATMSGEARADCLVGEFGEKGFDYVGSGQLDLPVWRSARRVFVVAGSPAFERRVLSEFASATIVARPSVALRDVLRALRPHQWAKNSLVCLGLIAGHRFQASEILATVAAFCCFCMAASSAYILNDLLDLPSDRAHRSKSGRPFASGAVPIRDGIGLAAALGLGAFSLSLTLPAKFSLILFAYLVATLSYSLFWKRKVIADIVVLAGLYTLRVMGGMSALGADQAQWLLMFSFFLFGSLAIVKRCSELTAIREDGKDTSLGRGYRTEDLNVLLSCGTAAGYGSILVFALYLYSPEVRALYSHPDRLWLICPLLMYWLSRIFVLSNRNHLHEDPVVFALTDRNSLLTGFCVAVVLAASI